MWACEDLYILGFVQRTPIILCTLGWILRSGAKSPLNHHPGLGREPGGAPTEQPDRRGDGEGEARARGAVPAVEERVQGEVQEQRQRHGRPSVQGGARHAGVPSGRQHFQVSEWTIHYI